MAVVSQVAKDEKSSDAADSRIVSELMRRLDEKAREADKLKTYAARLEEEMKELAQKATEPAASAPRMDSDQEMELDALRAKAGEFDRKGNLLDAFYLYRRIIRMNPNDIDALYHVATIYYSAGMTVKAKSVLQLIVDMDPGQQRAMESLEETQLEAAATLGSGPIDRFFSVVFPLCKRGFVTATCLAFAHTVGEFGIVLMIGGNIPGETRVVSIAIYDHVESLQYANAHILATAMLLFCFLLLLIIYTTNRRFNYRLVQAG